MYVKYKQIKSLLLLTAFLLFFIDIAFSQHNQNNELTGSENFILGMFSVVGNNAWSQVPGTQEF